MRLASARFGSAVACGTVARRADAADGSRCGCGTLLCGSFDAPRLVDAGGAVVEPRIAATECVSVVSVMCTLGVAACAKTERVELRLRPISNKLTFRFLIEIRLQPAL